MGRAHIEGFGSFKGVKRTKGELYDYLHAKPTARIFINESNYDLQDMLVKRDIDIDTDKCIAYAREQALTMTWVCEGDVLDCDPMLRLWWRPKYDGQHEVQTRLIGAYNIDNVLSAVAIGLHFGVTPEAIDHALATYQPSLGRSEYRRTEHNELIVDAYNANLTSMQAALDNFRRISHPQKMVILGDMKELGAVSDDAHRQIAAQALGSDLQAAWFVGDEFRKAISAQAPAASTDIRCFETVEDVKAALADGGTPAGRLILIKGSNSTKLHQLPDVL